MRMNSQNKALKKFERTVETVVHMKPESGEQNNLRTFINKAKSDITDALKTGKQ